MVTDQAATTTTMGEEGKTSDVSEMLKSIMDRLDKLADNSDVVATRLSALETGTNLVKEEKDEVKPPVASSQERT